MRNPTRDYKSVPFSHLPFAFINKRLRKNCYWVVQPTGDYQEACTVGQEYAAHYIQWLKDNPDSPPTLELIVRDMAKASFSNYGTRGYAMGFLIHLERMLTISAGQTDVWDDIDRLARHQVQALKDAGITTVTSPPKPEIVRVSVIHKPIEPIAIQVLASYPKDGSESEGNGHA